MDSFEMPEAPGDLTAEEISSKITEARDSFNVLNASDDVSDDTLDRMEFLVESIEALKSEQGRRVKREELAGRVTEVEVVEAAAETVEVEVDVKAEAEAPAVEAEAPKAEAPKAEAPKAEAPKAEAPEVEVPEVEVTETSVEAAAEVEASGVALATTTETKENLIVIAPDTSVPEDTVSQVLIAAAQDVPQFYVGQRLDPLTLADALHNKARMLSDSRGLQTVYPVATIERPFGDGYDLEGLDQAGTWDRLNEMSKPGALVASGGWCAPSQIVYDLFEVECENDLLFALPTFRVTRGGIRWPVFVPHDEAYNPGFTWTEQNDIAATGGNPTKPCVRINCPTFSECRLDASGLCVTAGNLIDRAYPEQVRWFLNRAMRAYERNVAARKLNLVLADTTPVALPATFGATSALISGLLLLANSYRQANGLCCNETLDLILPCWVTDMIKADVARQDSTLSVGSLPSDSEVKSWFEGVGLNIKFISHWQNFATNPATSWPASVQALIGYPGSYVEFNQGRLDLGVIRDSVLNATNDYTAVWFEEFYCVGRRGPKSYLATIPVCPSGEVGGRNPSSGEVVCPIA